MDETVLNRLITDMEPEMFYSDQNRAVHDHALALYRERSCRHHHAGQRPGNGGTFASADDAKVYITHIAETVPAISNVDSYFKIVKEKYQARRLIEAARSILSETASGEDAELLLESAEQKIYDIRSGRDKSGVKTIRESILEVIDTMQKLSGADRDKFAGIPTGFNYLDTVLTGLGRSDLIILAARPGMGKTSFALNIATNVARQQKVPTIIFSLEMTCEQLTDRILSSTANIDSQAFRTGLRTIRTGTTLPRLRRFCTTRPSIWTIPPAFRCPRSRRRSAPSIRTPKRQDRSGDHRLPAADAERQAHREPRAGDQLILPET